MGGAVVKGGYRIYVPYRATICKLCGRLYPKHIRKRSDFFELAASHIQPGTLSVVDLTVFGMEEGHVRQGSRHVFVENLKLLEMLQSAHMDVGEDNLGIKTGGTETVCHRLAYGEHRAGGGSVSRVSGDAGGVCWVEGAFPKESCQGV